MVIIHKAKSLQPTFPYSARAPGSSIGSLGVDNARGRKPGIGEQHEQQTIFGPGRSPASFPWSCSADPGPVAPHLPLGPFRHRDGRCWR